MEIQVRDLCPECKGAKRTKENQPFGRSSAWYSWGWQCERCDDNGYVYYWIPAPSALESELRTSIENLQ